MKSQARLRLRKPKRILKIKWVGMPECDCGSRVFERSDLTWHGSRVWFCKDCREVLL